MLGRGPLPATPSTPSGRFPPEPRSGGTGGGTYTGRLPASGTPSVRHHLTDGTQRPTAPPDARAGESRPCTGDACASVTLYPRLPTLSPGGAAHPRPYQSPWDHPPAHHALPTFSSILRVRHHRHNTQHPSLHAAHLTAVTPPPYAGATDPIPPWCVAGATPPSPVYGMWPPNPNSRGKNAWTGSDPPGRPPARTKGVPLRASCTSTAPRRLAHRHASHPRGDTTSRNAAGSSLRSPGCPTFPAITRPLTDATHHARQPEQKREHRIPRPACPCALPGMMDHSSPSSPQKRARHPRPLPAWRGTAPLRRACHLAWHPGTRQHPPPAWRAPSTMPHPL